MKARTETEDMLLEQVEKQASRMNIVLAMLRFYTDNSPFPLSEYVSAEARKESQLCAARYLDGVTDLLEYYHRDADQMLDRYFIG